MRNRIGSLLPRSLEGGADTAGFLGLAGSISMALVSVAAAQILLAVALAAACGLAPSRAASLARLKWVLLPLALYCAWTVLAALAAPDVALALASLKKFYLLLIIPLTPLLAPGQNRLAWISRAIIAVALLSAVVGLVQYGTHAGGNDLLDRITGFMGHWMTYSGLLMLALVLLAAYGLHTGWKWLSLWIPAAAVLALAIVLSQTRNAVLGAAAGTVVVLLLGMALERKRRYGMFLAILVLGAASAWLLAPAPMQQRFRSGLDPGDPNTRNRIELYGTSMRIIRDNPWFGVGPRNVKLEALKYRNANEFPDWLYQHMHNNVLQVAAETGLPGLTFWLWFMLGLAWNSLGTYRHALSGSFPHGDQGRREAVSVASAAAGSWAALMLAGMFEYNFGDSEVLMLFLFIASAPFAYAPGAVRSRAGGDGAAPAAGQ